MKKKNILSFILAGLITLGTVSCAKDQTEDTTPDTEPNAPAVETAGGEAGGEETEPESEERIKPNIPESADFGGDDIHFIHWYNPGWEDTVRYNRDIYAEGITGEGINDTVYNRNIKIEEAYKVKISLEMVENTALATMIAQIVTTGDQNTDVIYQVLSAAPGSIQKSYFRNLFDVPTIDLSQPWWDQNCVESLSAGGMLPVVATSINVNDKDATAAIAFNKTLAAANQLPDVYSLVREGKWTYDKLSELAELVSNDSNGDGLMSPDDVYGFLGGRDVIDSLFHGSGSLYVTKDENDSFIFSFGSERDIDAVSKGIDICNQPWYFNHHAWSDQSDSFYRQMFEQGHGLFFWMRLDDVTNMRAGDADFGIIPIPKYGETQEQYASLVSQHTTGLMSIPITKAGEDLENLGIILEALAAESHYTLIPEYIETSLKTKNSRDAESADMLDIIISHRVFDPMNVYSFSGFGDAIMDACDANNKDLASLIKSKQKLVNKMIERTMDAISQVSE